VAAVNFTLNIGKVKKNSRYRAHFTFGDLELLLTFNSFSRRHLQTGATAAKAR
jgi:hypothetical protein